MLGIKMMVAQIKTDYTLPMIHTHIMELVISISGKIQFQTTVLQVDVSGNLTATANVTAYSDQKDCKSQTLKQSTML